MRREEKLLKTMSALRDCLDECRQAHLPLKALEQYVDCLRCDPKWDNAEVIELETTVRRAIEARGGAERV